MDYIAPFVRALHLVEGPTLYEVPFTPRCRRVRMLLAEKGLRVRSVDVGTDRLRPSDAYMKRYPERTVPMLELEDGTQIGESIAICRYFERLFPEPPLFGRTPKESALIEMWEQRAYTEGMGATEDIFRNTHPLMADRGLPGTDEPVPQIPALAERGRNQLRRFFRKFENQLSVQPFVAGGAFSFADITLLSVVDFAIWCEQPVPAECRGLIRWHAEISSRPSALV
jgi:glutathione S-transferase